MEEPKYVVTEWKRMGGAVDVERIPEGSGDPLSENYLRESDLREYFEGTETVEYLLTSEKKGIKHVRDDETTHVTPGSEYRSVAAITDERVLLAVGDSADEDHPEIDRSVSLPYTEIRSVETSKGMLKSRLSITARTSDEYHFLLGGRENLDAVAEFIRRGISHWVGVEQRLDRARDRLSAVESAIEDGKPDAASEKYREARELLDEAGELAAEYRSDEHAMHRRIDQLETRLTMTELRGHRIRGHQLVTSAESARSQGNYRSAHDDYAAALDQYDRAVALADEIDHHELEDIRAEYESAQGGVAQLESEPLREALDAAETAVESDDQGVDAWADALEATHAALAITLRYDRFDGDPDALRYQVEWTAANLVEARGVRAHDAEQRGDEVAGTTATREAYERAHEELAAAHDVACEFRAGNEDAIATARDRVAEKLAALDE